MFYLIATRWIGDKLCPSLYTFKWIWRKIPPNYIHPLYAKSTIGDHIQILILIKFKERVREVPEEFDVISIVACLFIASLKEDEAVERTR